MTEERRVQLVAEVDTTRTREGFAEIGQQAGTMGSTVERVGAQAQQAVSNIGNGADGAARKVEAAQRSLIQSIQRTTAQMEAGARTGAAYFEVLARQRGIDPQVLAPYLAQLRSVEDAQARSTQALAAAQAEQQQAAEATRAQTAAQAAAQRELAQAQAGREAFLNSLREQIALYGRSTDEILRYRAAQIGAADAASPLILQLQNMRAAQEQATAAARAEAQAQREAAQAQAGRDSFLQSLEQQANAIGRTRAELLELQAAQLGVSTQAAPLIARLREAEGGLTRTGVSAAQTANAMRMVPMQVTDIITSLQGGQAPLTVFLQQGGQLRDTFGSSGAAARALASYVAGLVTPYTVAAAAAVALAVAYNQGSKEADAYTKAILTSGNAAGESVAMMADAARGIGNVVGTQAQAAEAVAALTSTGQVNAQNMQKFGQVAIEVQRNLGRSVQDTVNDFAELGKSPVQASQKLNDQYRYLTASVMAQIRALDEQGRTDEAAEVAQSAYATAFGSRAAKMQEHLGTLQKGWIGVTDFAKKAWDAMLDVGREKTPQQELDEVNKAIARAKKAFDPSVGGNAEDRASLKKNEARKVQLEFVIAKDKWDAAQTQISQQLEAAAQKWDAQGDQFLSREQQRDKAIAKARVEGLAAGASDKEINGRVAAINKSYADLYNATVDSQIEARKRLDQVQDVLTQRELARIAALRADGGMSEVDAINQTADAELAAMERKRKALVDELELTKHKENSTKDQAELNGQIDVLDEQFTNRKLQRTNDLAAAERKRWDQSNQLYINGLAAAQAEEQSLRDQTKAQVESNEQIGLNKVQLAALQAVRIEHLASLKDEAAAELDAIKPGTELAESYRAQAQALRERAAAVIEGGDKEFRYDQFKQSVDQYGQVFQTGFADMLNHAHDGWRSFTRSLTTTFKTSVADELYKMFAKPFVVQLVGSFLGVSQQAIAGEIAAGSPSLGGRPGGTTATASSPIGMAQAASNIYGMFKSGGSFETSITNGVQSMFDKLGLSQGAGAPGEIATWAGRAGGTVGGYMIGSSLNSAISGQYQTGSGFMTAEKVGTAIASYFGGAVGGAIAGAISGLVNRAFGMGSVETKSSGIMGWLNGTGAGGQTFQQMHQDGGWFRSDKDWTDAKNFDAATVAQLSQAFLAIRSSAQQAAQTLGVSSASIDQFATEFKLQLTGDAAANEKAITDFFAGISDQLAHMAMPNLDEFSKTGESASATLQRLVSDFQATDLMAQMLGKTAVDVFGNVGVESAKARERLIGLAGGADVLGQQAAFYAQNFLTDAQRLEPVQKALDAAMASLGLSSVTTREQFKACIDSLDLTTEAGAQQFSSMMALAGAFAQVHPAIEAIVTTARSAADVLSERNGLLDQLAQLTMSKEDYDKSKLDSSNFDVYGQVQAARAAKEANDKAKASADALAQVNKTFQDQIDAILKGRMSEAEVRALETAGMDDSTRALYDRLAGLKAEDAAAAAWQQRKAEILAADNAAADQAKAVATERMGLQGQLDQLTMSSAQLLIKQRDALNASNQALFDQIQIASKAKSVADERMGLQDQLDQATMTSAQVLAKQRAALDESNRALFDQVQIATKANAVATERKGLQDQLDAATMTSAQLLAKQRDALDESNRALFDQIQVAKTAAQAAADAQEAIQKAQAASAATVQSYGDALAGSMTAATAAAKALRDFNDSLVLGNLSPLSTEERYRAAKALYGTNPSDTAAATAFLQASKDRGADDFYYQRDFAAVQGNLASAAAVKDAFVAAMPAFWQSIRQTLSSPDVEIPAVNAGAISVAQAVYAASTPASANTAALEAKVDLLIEKLGGSMEIVAASTSQLATQFDLVTEGGNGMVTA
jgi:phage-related minor tail protein